MSPDVTWQPQTLLLTASSKGGGHSAAQKRVSNNGNPLAGCLGGTDQGVLTVSGQALPELGVRICVPTRKGMETAGEGRGRGSPRGKAQVKWQPWPDPLGSLGLFHLEVKELIPVLHISH